MSGEETPSWVGVPPQLFTTMMEWMQKTSERLGHPPQEKTKICDVFLPSFDPDSSVGVQEWCNHIDTAVTNYQLSDFDTRMKNERSFVSFYLFKLIVVGLVWTPAMVITIWQKYYAFYDPTFNYTMNPNYPVVRIMFFSAITLYFLYLIILIVKAYSDLRNMPFFETTIIKHNPAFSMINDSDEEVIYGSDEESHRPLNSHHRTNEDI